MRVAEDYVELPGTAIRHQHRARNADEMDLGILSRPANRSSHNQKPDTPHRPVAIESE